MKNLMVIALLMVACDEREAAPPVETPDVMTAVDATMPEMDAAVAARDTAPPQDMVMMDTAPTCGGFNQRCCNGTTCAVGGVCSGGLCVCDRVRTACGFQCMDLQSDPDNCGACGVRCAFNEACCGGMCTSPIRDPANCGGCGIACDPPNHNTMTCSTGKCGIGVCDSGWADCNHNTADGCETSITTTDNCGACGNKCPTCAHCVNGACTYTPAGGACTKICECASPFMGGAPGTDVLCGYYQYQKTCCQFKDIPYNGSLREYFYNCGKGWVCMYLFDGMTNKYFPCP